MDKNDTRRVLMKRAIIKFKKQHLQGFSLLEDAEKIASKFQSKGFQRALNEKFDMKQPICNQQWMFEINDLAEKYCKLTELNMQSRLEDVQFSFVEASQEAKTEIS